MKFSFEAPVTEPPQLGEIDLHIRFRPMNLFGLGLALLLHVLILYMVLQHQVHKKHGDAAAQNVMIMLQDKAAIAQVARAERKKATGKAVAIPPSRHAITPPKSAPVEAAETPVTPPAPVVEEPQDMMAMLNAARARRHAADDAARQENEAAAQAGRGSSAQEIAQANVRRSLQQAAGREGTGGVFQILSKSTRMASFSFRGWKPSAMNSFKQVIEVDAGLGGDVDLAIIRRMIVLIRTHYTGDFQWDSHRLGRVVTLSARPQDTAELEAFMMREFFGNVS